MCPWHQVSCDCPRPLALVWCRGRQGARPCSFSRRASSWRREGSWRTQPQGSSCQASWRQHEEEQEKTSRREGRGRTQRRRPLALQSRWEGVRDMVQGEGGVERGSRGPWARPRRPISLATWPSCSRRRSSFCSPCTTCSWLDRGQERWDPGRGRARAGRGQEGESYM